MNGEISNGECGYNKCGGGEVVRLFVDRRHPPGPGTSGVPSHAHISVCGVACTNQCSIPSTYNCSATGPHCWPCGGWRSTGRPSRRPRPRRSSWRSWRGTRWCWWRGRRAAGRPRRSPAQHGPRDCNILFSNSLALWALSDSLNLAHCNLH